MSNPRVLIAEDQSDLILMLQLYFRNAYYEVDVASSAEQARSLYDAALKENRPYALLILDIAMPDKSGLSLAKEIRQDDKVTKMAFLTGFDRVMNRLGADDVDAVGYWTKPIELPHLKQKIEKILSEAKVLS